MTEDDKKPKDRVKEQLVTYDMYAAMPDDGQRYEIIEGVLELMSPGPNTVHQSISFELATLLKQACKSDYMIFIAPLDVILSSTDVRQPDVIMVHRSRSSIVTRRGIEGAPDLVVETLSPGSRRRDKLGKMTTYAKYGVPEYWIVDPDAVVLEQYLLHGDQYVLSELFEGEDVVSSEKFPCAVFRVSDLFHEIPDFN